MWRSQKSHNPNHVGDCQNCTFYLIEWDLSHTCTHTKQVHCVFVICRESKTKTELGRAKNYEKMVRPSGKHGSARLVVICVSLLGLALIADFLWASSSSSSSSSNLAFSSYHDLILPSNDKPKQPPPKKVSFLLITFMFFLCILWISLVGFFGIWERREIQFVGLLCLTRIIVNFSFF